MAYTPTESNRPVYSSASDTLRRMSDSQIENISKKLQEYIALKYWESNWHTGYDHGSPTEAAFGSFFMSWSGGYNPVDGDAINKGTLYDTSYTAVQTSNANNNEPIAQPNAYAGDDDDSFGTPSEASFNDTLATAQTFYKESYDNATAPSQPSTSDLNSHGYLIWDSSGYVKVESETANILDTVIKLANAAMLSGDKVGTYHISTSDPSEGAGHTWSDLGTFIEDTISTYAFPNTTGSSVAQTHKLWLKTAAPLDSVEDSAALANFMQWSSSGDIGLKQIDRGTGTSTYSNIATNVIIPIWKNSSIFPKYKFSASNSLAGGWEALKGSYNDTYYLTSQTASPALSSGTYYSARYGLATTTTNTEYMILYIGSSTDSYR